MKKLVAIVVALSVLAVAVPVMVSAQGMSKDQKDQCLLASKNCALQANTIQQKIEKLNAEIEKGTRVYTPEELKKLEQKLKEVEAVLDTLTTEGSK